MKVMNTLCLFTLKTILIGYRPQNYVNKQWVLHNLTVNQLSTSTIYVLFMLKWLMHTELFPVLDLDYYIIFVKGTHFDSGKVFIRN